MMDKKTDRELLREMILREAPRKSLPCRSAFLIAERTGCSLGEIGELCNELKVKIAGCQLGCF